jgi:hypothetical protein
MARLSKAREAQLRTYVDYDDIQDLIAELTAVREERDALMAAARHIGRAPSQATLQIVRDTVAKIEAAEKERG